MAQTEDVIIEKVTNGLERPAPNIDSTSALVIGGVAVVGGIQLNTPVLLYSVEDAEDLGIDAAYDTTNDVLVHHHISEFYRLAAGQPLYLLLVAQATTLTQMCDIASTNGLNSLRVHAGGKIRQAGVVLSPITGYTPTITTGIADDVLAAIPKAQQTAKAAYDLHAPLEVILEGRGFDPTSAGATVDLRTFDAELVSVVVVQDLDICAIDVLHESYAAVGAYLGMTASKGVANSPAEVGLEYEGNLQDEAAGRFMNYGMANQPLSAFSSLPPTGGDQQIYRNKHFVILKEYPDVKGVYFRQSFTCAADTNDILFIELSRAYNKCHREIYKKYVPYINAKFKLTPQGYLPPEVVKDLERIGNKVFGTMASNGEISVGKTVIDPKQNLTVTREIEAKWDAVPMGKAATFKGKLSFKVNI